jgi:hypothetical protein
LHPESFRVPGRNPREKRKNPRFRTGVMFRINNQSLAVDIGLKPRDPLIPC